jgi:PEGA domain
LREFDSALLAPERKSVRDSVAELTLSVGHLALDCDVADALVLVDGEARGTTPLPALLLNPGLHVVRVLKQGYEPAQVSLTIAATETSSWHPQLLRLNDYPRPSAPEPRAPAPKALPARPGRFSVELAAGPALYHSLGGGADASCGSDVLVADKAEASCPGRNFLSLGFLVSARLGYRIESRVSFEVTLGYLRLWHDLTRRLSVSDANGQVYDTVPRSAGQPSSWLVDQTRVSMPFAGIGASRQFFQRTPLLARLTTGIGRANVRTAVNGSFSAESVPPSVFPISVIEDPRTLWVPFIAPEVRFGYRFASGWVGDIGLAVWLLWAPSYPRTTSVVAGTPAEERWVLHADGSGDALKLGSESALGASLFVVPSLSVRHAF